MRKPTGLHRDARGFTFLETIVSLAVLLAVMAIAFSFFAQFGGYMNTETNTLATQQAARVALDDLSRKLRMVGYGTSRVAEFNPASWQRGLIYGNSSFLAFNADIDSTIGSLPTSQTISLPGGATYTGQGIAASQTGAETYVYTLDANGDNAVTAADRTAAVSASFNPAADTPNPMDFALFSRVYGYNGTDYGGALEPLAANLFTNATTDAVYPDGTTPAPLFVYWLSEDLNGDGALQDAECVNDAIASCPPSAERPPVLYMWGDTNFDGQLSESEKTALRTMEVGSTAWSKNRLASGGAYKSTTLSTAINPASAGANQAQVADGTKLGPGYFVQIGTGSGAEVLTVSQVSTASTPHRIMFMDYPTKPHAVGDSITVLPTTLLSAVRSVGLTFSAITSLADSQGGAKIAGRAGRAGTQGLDYRVTPYSRQIEVVNVPTAAYISDGSGNIESVCPVDIINQCNAGASASSTRYQGFSGSSGISFKVTDAMGNPLPGKSMSFSNSNASVGTLGAVTAKADSTGIATVPYTLAGALGTDTITASASCVNSAGVTTTDSATHQVTVYRVTAAMTQDCISTVSTRTPAPSSNFSVQVTGSSGPVSGHALAMGVAFDAGYLPPSPDFTQLRGALSISGGGSGDTGTSGSMTPISVSTDGGGQINGTVSMASDGPATGARLNLVTAAPSGTCSAGGSMNTKMDFYKLALDSTIPTSGCSETSPCSIPADANPPQVRATLTIGGDPVSPANLQFTRADLSPPSGAFSRIVPTSGLVTTDSTGQGTLRIMNNGAPSISTSTPLRTQIDVSATAPSYCSAGTIASSSPKAQFDMTGPIGVCTLQMNQAWVSKISTKKICVHVKNVNPTGGCPLRVTGFKLSLYDAAGIALDPLIVYQQVQGGAVSASPTCSTSGSVQLNKDDCQSPKAKLNNGQQWNFTTLGSCNLPTTSVNPGQYFTIHNIEFPSNYPVGRRLNIQVNYACEGVCDCGTVDTQSFDVTTPS